MNLPEISHSLISLSCIGRPLKDVNILLVDLDFLSYDLKQKVGKY